VSTAEELAAIRALLFFGVCDQTWCVCLGPEDGQHHLVIHGWDEYEDLPLDSAEDTAAALLHKAGFRAGMSLDEAIALLDAAAMEGK